MRHRLSAESLQDYRDDEIDLVELWKVIWTGKWIVIGITAIFALGSVFYAMTLPDIYRSSALLASADTEKSGGLSGLAAQYGGLAAMAGINIGSGGDRIDEGLAVLKSRKFIGDFIERHDLWVPLMAVKRWGGVHGKLVVDESVYDEEARRWVREVESPRTSKPSVQEAYEKFVAEHLSVSVDKATSFVTLAIEHSSPYVAQEWVTWLISDLNNAIKVDDVASAERSIAYLQQQLGQTAVADLQAVFYQLIEGQMKTIMLANAREEYLFRTLDPAIVPEQKAKPKRAMICVMGTLIGGILSIVLVFALNYIRKDSLAIS